MEYLKGNAFLGDFAQRTLKNLQVIENQNTDDAEKFEVTQLVNSLLGLIVFPRERGINLTGYVACVSTLKKYVMNHKSNLTNKELMRNLRHAISHSHIFFEKSVIKDKKGNYQIESITFVNCDYGNNGSPCGGKICDKCRLKQKSNQAPDFQLTIPISELRTCVEEFAKEIIAISISKTQKTTK